jgi:hypothetical protein
MNKKVLAGARYLNKVSVMQPGTFIHVKHIRLQ